MTWQKGLVAIDPSFTITFYPCLLTNTKAMQSTGGFSFHTDVCICTNCRSCKYRSSPSTYWMWSGFDSDWFQMLQRKFPQNPWDKQSGKNWCVRTDSSQIYCLADSSPEKWYLMPFPNSLSSITSIMYVLFSEACVFLSVLCCILPPSPGLYQSLHLGASDTTAAQPLLRVQKMSGESMQRQGK